VDRLTGASNQRGDRRVRPPQTDTSSSPSQKKRTLCGGNLRVNSEARICRVAFGPDVCRGLRDERRSEQWD
jgi:hypothetical protein